MGKLNDISFVKGNGGMGRSAVGEDHISGLIMYLPEIEAADLINANNSMQFDSMASEDGDNTLYAAQLRYVEELADYGIENQSMAAADVVGVATVAAYQKRAALNAVYYQVAEFFRMNNAGVLYLMIRVAGDNIAATDIVQLQNYANGSIRQCGVLTPTLANIAAYQTICTTLENEHKPLSLVVSYAGKTIAFTQGGMAGAYTYTGTTTAVTLLTALASIDTNYVFTGRCNLSLIVGCDLDGEVLLSLGQYGYYGAIGTTIGAVSKASVHECIAYVAKFPLSFSAPGLISGELIKDVSTANQERINDNRYLFIRVHVGDSDNYFNDSHTLDLSTSDYAYIENERTIDKACRGVRTNLLPYLNSPLKVDAAEGTLAPSTVAFLQTTAGKALEDMEKAGELSGYSCEIDPEQNVLSTSTVEIVIKNVPMGVMRKVNVKIGFTTKI